MLNISKASRPAACFANGERDARYAGLKTEFSATYCQPCGFNRYVNCEIQGLNRKKPVSQLSNRRQVHRSDGTRKTIEGT